MSIKRTFKILILAELCYLLLVNGALYLPLTQTLVNKIKPDKFHVSWEQAWSWYPFRVHALGIEANGQSRSQQWQVSVPEAAGSIALLPLIAKRVWVSNVSARDVDYRQRPRLKSDKDYTVLLPYFPQIEGREIVAADTSERKKKRPWHIEINGMRAVGTHQLWIHQFQGEVSGEASAALTYQTRGGPFSLDADEVDLDIAHLSLQGDRPILQRGKLQGSLGFAPFVPRQNKGVAMLRFLRLDLEVDVERIPLAFINAFTMNIDGMFVSGEGQAAGTLRLDQGWVKEGTQLSIIAPALQVTAAEHDIRGEGVVALALGPDTDQQLALAFQFENLKVVHQRESLPLLAGDELLLRVGGDGYVLRREGEMNSTRSVAFEIDDLEVPDLSLLQRYLPERWPLRLLGGNGTLSGEARLAPTALYVDLQLESEDAEAAVADYHFETDLSAALKLDNPQLIENLTSVGGSYIRLGRASLLREEGEEEASDAPTWEAYLQVSEGEFGLLGSERKQEEDDAVDLLKLLGQSQAKQLLAESTGSFVFQAGITDLAWMGLFLGDNYQARVSGEGTLEGRTVLSAGLPEPGTQVTVRSPELGLDILGYTIRGDGLIELEVREGGEFPDWYFDIQLQDAQLRRSDEEQAMVQQVNLTVGALAQDVSFTRDKPKLALQLEIDSAKITDMSTFNRYLPPEAALRFTSGEADLTADILLQPEQAAGWLLLDARDVRASSDEQRIKGNLKADIQLSGGLPSKLQFDISGSQLLLDEVQVMGENAEFSGEHWSAVFDLEYGLIRWGEPLYMDARAGLKISDSRPFVALFDNQGWRPKFFTEMLTVTDIVGYALLHLEDRRLEIADAAASSDHIEFGARLVADESARNGVLYLSYKEHDALLKITDGKKNLDIINALKKYQAYKVPVRPAP